MFNLGKLPQLPADKANHFLYGLGAGLIGAFLAALVGALPWHGGLIAAALVGIGKEMVDKFARSGDPSLEDAVATVAGGAAVALATVIGGIA